MKKINKVSIKDRIVNKVKQHPNELNNKQLEYTWESTYS